ncbi:MAG: hypothetical protein RID07_15020, partial [Lacipirellulaceae bacterium]
DRTLNHLSSSPEIYPLDVVPIRFAKVQRFPYLIFFAARKDIVLVLAVLHGSTDPSKWRSRLEGQ